MNYSPVIIRTEKYNNEIYYCSSIEFEDTIEDGFQRESSS